MSNKENTPEFIHEIESFEEMREAESQIEETERKKAEELEKGLVAEYLERTSRKKAVEDLLFNINTIQQGFTRVWPTGIEALDERLDGGLHPNQLVFLGAISSLGKTSFALQIADNVARSGRDVLVFSLEMSSDELLSKSISRESYLLSCGDKSKEKLRLTTQDILSGRIGEPGDEKRRLFEVALQNAQEANEHLFYFIGNNDVDVDLIRDIVELHRRARRQDPLVIIDYLQILRPSEDALSRRLDKRLLTDDDVTKLKVMSRECNIPVIAISAFNRESYLQSVSSSSFKESSGIEYSSDVLLGLQYTNMDYKRVYFTKNGKRKKGYENKQGHEIRVRNLFDDMEKADVRPLELKILKNRNGKRGSVFLDFVAPYNYFRETGTSKRKPPEWVEVVENEEIPFEEEDDIIRTV